MTILPAGDWISLTEAAAIIGITQARLSVLAKQGRIASYRVGRSVMILKSAAIEFRDIPRKHGRPRREEPPAPPKKKRK